jgi:hypothetical protein
MGEVLIHNNLKIPHPVFDGFGMTGVCAFGGFGKTSNNKHFDKKEKAGFWPAFSISFDCSLEQDG